MEDAKGNRNLSYPGGNPSIEERRVWRVGEFDADERLFSRSAQVSFPMSIFDSGERTRN